MALPPRVHFTLQEAAARWDCTLADIAGWASVGRFDIVTAIPTVIRGRQIISGYVVVSVTDIMQMFRRCGTGPSKCILRRVRPRDQEEWIMIADIPERIEVSLADLVIMAVGVRPNVALAKQLGVELGGQGFQIHVRQQLLHGFRAHAGLKIVLILFLVINHS